MKQYRLSKSKYLAAFQCHKRLWLEIHGKDKATPIDNVQEAIFNQGHYVGELARDCYPGGILIDSDYLDIPLGIKNTLNELAKNPPSLYEGFFQYNNVLVRPDIMVNNGDGSWDFIEVKSSTTLKPENIRDVAVQTYVLVGSKINIRNSYLMHINRECAYPDLSNLFALEDLTERIKPFIQKMEESLDSLRNVLSKNTAPNISIGSHCTKPYNCSFKDYCWKNIPEYSVFNIPRLKTNKKEDLYKKGIINIKDFKSSDYELKQPQQDFINSFKTKKPIINLTSIENELKKLQYPLYFLDFETFGPAVPKFNGMHPYEQYPFQFSCHILDRKQNVSHREYLHTDTQDPRQPIIESLIETLNSKGEGTIIAFNAGFEKGVISKLIQSFPKYEKQLSDINARFWDQLIIFKKYYTDYRFKGSNSLKSVLPILTPDIPNMNYDNLDVSNGGQAQVVWSNMIQLPASKKKDELINQLIEYCKLDTYAMVKIHEILNDKLT